MAHGMRCAVTQRALFDEIRRLSDEWDGVVSVDMCCAAQMVSIRRMHRYRWTRYWYRDIRRLDRILPLADEGARSRPEVDLRRIWTEHAGWPHPLCNRTILDLDGLWSACRTCSIRLVASPASTPAAATAVPTSTTAISSALRRSVG